MLNGAEQYFSRNLNEVSVHLNEYRQHLLIFSLWYISRGPYHFSTIQTIHYLFCFFTYQFFVVANLATMFRIKSPAPKSAWRLKWSQLGGLQQERFNLHLIHVEVINLFVTWLLFTGYQMALVGQCLFEKNK